MFASKLKSLTPGSSKSTSPVPPEFEVEQMNKLKITLMTPVMTLSKMVMTKRLMFCRQQP